MHTFIHIYIHTYIHTYMHTYIHTYIRTYIHTYIHVHTYVHNYTYIIIHIHIRSLEGPVFSKGKNATSIWTEMEEGKDGVLQCTVIKSYPKVTELVVIPDGENVNIIKVNDTSIRVMITKANMNNSINYTCFASTDKTQAFLTYQNFVGGKNLYNVMIII